MTNTRAGMANGHAGSRRMEKTGNLKTHLSETSYILLFTFAAVPTYPPGIYHV